MQPPRLYRFGTFLLNAGERVLSQNGKSLALEPKALDLLLTLVEYGGRLVTKDELMKRVWPDTFVEENNLSVGIAKVRKALGESRGHHPYIETVPRRGYRFVACVTEELDQGTATQTKVYTTNAASNGRARKITIAVLPFKPIGKVSDEHLCLGMADALITRLSNLRPVIVRPTSSVRNYNGTQDPVSAGRELSVEWVLDGSVQQSGKRVRVTLQLVNVIEGVPLWAETLDEEWADVFVVEDSICERMLKGLWRELILEAKRRRAKRFSESAAA